MMEAIFENTFHHWRNQVPMDTVAVFCAIDDFCRWFEPWWEQRLLGVYAQTAENSVQPLDNGFLGQNRLIFMGSGIGVKT
jgi:hypothetical protein